MKRSNSKKIAWLSASLLIFLSACSLKQMAKMAKEQELTVTPSPLELHGDSVKFDVSVVLPVKMLKKNKLYTVKTWYQYGDPSASLEQFNFQDTEFPNQKVEQPSIKKSYSVGYLPGMETGSLKIKGIASNLEKTKYEETPEMEIAKGLIMTSRLYEAKVTPIFADHGYNNNEEVTPYNVNFYFDQGSAKLKKSETVGEQGKLLTAFIASKNKTRTVTITGAHSPEGLESVNSQLAEERAKVIREFYYQKMKQFDYKNFADSIKFETKAKFQDWSSFKTALSGYTGISETEKGEVMTIVNGASSFEEKAKELSQLSFYKKILSDVYPKLRISQTEILTIKPKKTNSEISVLTTGIYKGLVSQDTLSVEELMYAATMTPLIEEKIKIYEVAAKKGDLWSAYNNLGACYLSLANKTTDAATKEELIGKAKAQFELAMNKEANAISSINLASANVVTGDFKAADAVLAKATGAQSTATAQGINELKGLIALRKGKYDDAIKAYSSVATTATNSHNLGLAYLLKKDLTKAETNLEKASSEDLNNAKTLYLRAVTAAKQSNETALGILLAQAVQKDATYKQKALTDLEFAKYATSPVFTNALK
jgi:tetratricopeptide (TPR) repeat protein